MQCLKRHKKFWPGGFTIVNTDKASFEIGSDIAKKCLQLVNLGCLVTFCELCNCSDSFFKTLLTQEWSTDPFPEKSLTKASLCLVDCPEKASLLCVVGLVLIDFQTDQGVPSEKHM